MKQALIGMAVNFALRTPLEKYIGYRYQHMFSPSQLSFLIRCLDETKHLTGAVFEVGCAAGMTTVWLNKHLDTLGERPYVAIDTFAGFLERDIEHEIQRRGKAPSEATLRSFFASNGRTWVERTLRRNGVKRVSLIQGDAAEFDYSKYQDISFALIDVDLYLPVKATLERIFPQMAPGGIIVVDDCADRHLWDGALQAYNEFVERQGLPATVVHGKLGVVRRPERV
jgi:hypothetical protein